MANFDLAVEYVLDSEGGFVDDPLDRGGCTNMGITQATLSRWLKHPATEQDVRDLERETAKEIYHDWYWLPVRGDAIEHQGVATCIFDIGVVCGTPTSVRLARMAIGAPAEGGFDHAMVERINAKAPESFIHRFVGVVSDRFCDIVVKNKSQTRFIKGWMRRAHRLLTLEGI